MLKSYDSCIPNTNINLHKQSNNNNSQSKVRYDTNRYSDFTKFKRDTKKFKNILEGDASTNMQRTKLTRRYDLRSNEADQESSLFFSFSSFTFDFFFFFIFASTFTVDQQKNVMLNVVCDRCPVTERAHGS